MQIVPSQRIYFLSIIIKYRLIRRKVVRGGMTTIIQKDQ